jgi:outer membrane murein-binding lipoprotein Lpp
MLTTRRSVLSLGAAALAGLGLAGCQTAAPARGTGGSIGSIAIDVTPLNAQGWGSNAALVKATMESELARIFAGRVQRGSPRLVVRVDSILTASYVGNSGSGGGGRFGGDSNAANDYLTSEARLIGPRGEVLATFPVLSAVPASSSGAWYLPGIDTRRLETLARHNASWIGRYVAGL